MTPPEDVVQSKKWLSRTASALDDACADVAYVTSQRKPIYLFFDPHFLYPPLALRRPLDINDPSDWLDISASIVFSNISKYRPRLLGYQFVLSHLTFLTIEKNYKIDIGLIDQLNSCGSDEQLFELIAKRAFGEDNPLSQQQAEDKITRFLASSLRRHDRLQSLLDLIKNKTIIAEASAIPAEVFRKSGVSLDDFKEFYRRIDAYRTSRQGGNSADQWTKATEALQLLRNRNVTDFSVEHKCLFLSWPGSRGYYPNPQNYHRIVTSIFFRLITLLETPDSVNDLVRSANAHLYDTRDHIEFLLRKVLASEKRGEELTPVIIRGILATRNEYIANLKGNLRMMEDSERAKLAKGFAGTKREVRDALKDAALVAKDTSRILSDIASEFRRDEMSSGWEELRPDHPIRQFLDGTANRPS